MSKYISNSEVMTLFKKVDEIRESELENIAEKKSKDIHNKIVTSMSFMVYHYSKPYRKFSNYEDIVQEGFVGLIRAVDRFKWQMFPNFFVYSERWILNGVKRAASRFDVVYNPNKTRVVYASPSELGISDELFESPEDGFLEREKSRIIIDTLADFSERDGDIVKRLYGLGDYDKQSLRAVGPVHDISYERVRQIKDNVISKLRTKTRLLELS